MNVYMHATGIPAIDVREDKEGRPTLEIIEPKEQDNICLFFSTVEDLEAFGEKITQQARAILVERQDAKEELAQAAKDAPMLTQP